MDELLPPPSGFTLGAFPTHGVFLACRRLPRGGWDFPKVVGTNKPGLQVFPDLDFSEAVELAERDVCWKRVPPEDTAVDRGVTCSNRDLTVRVLVWSRASRPIQVKLPCGTFEFDTMAQVYATFCNPWVRPFQLHYDGNTLVRECLGRLGYEIPRAY